MFILNYLLTMAYNDMVWTTVDFQQAIHTKPRHDFVSFQSGFLRNTTSPPKFRFSNALPPTFSLVNLRMRLAIVLLGFVGPIGRSYGGVGITFPDCSWSARYGLPCLGRLTNLFYSVDSKCPLFLA